MVRARFYFVVVVSAVLFAAGIAWYDLWSPDEPRYAQAAREMMQRGDYVVPHVNAEPYYEKPPLLFWLIAFFSVPFGDVNNISARAPSVASAIITVALTYQLALRLFTPRIALWAALILMTNLRFWWQARFGQIDMLLTACMTTSLFALWHWHTTRKRSWLVLLYAGLALGLLAKGPPALLFPLLAIFFFYWGAKSERRATHWIMGAVLALAPVVAWFVAARMLAADTTQAAAAQSVGDLFRNIVGRLFLGISKAQPPWYYLTTIPVDLMPWTLLLPWGIWWTWRCRRSSESYRFLLAWVVPALIFFSISIGKRNIYILPLWPAIAMLIAASLPPIIDEGRARWRRIPGGIWGACLLLLGAAPFVARYTVYADRIPLPVLLFGAWTGALGLVLLVRAFISTMPLIHVALASTFILVMLPASYTLLPVINTFKSAKEFCAPVRMLAHDGKHFRLYSVGFSREPYIFYSGHPHQERFTGLVGVDMAALDLNALREVAQEQKDVHKQIMKAVDSVPVAAMENITPEERAALRVAIEAAVADSGEDLERVRRFESALVAEIDTYLDEFGGETPAFMYVQDEDWRWLLPLATNPPKVYVIGHDQVSSREVLLLANPAGKTLLDRHRIANPEPARAPVDVESLGDLFTGQSPA